MKAPGFWKNNNVYSFILYPFSLIYGVVCFFYALFSTRYKTNKFKIICIGNLNVGGSGKTPIAIEIGKILKEKGVNFAYLSKGYKGAINDFTQVTTKNFTWDVGDEPILLSEVADTFICKNRKMAIKTLERDYNYDLIVMDDGFQNPTIYKDKSIIVIDGNYGIGNANLLPSGPLRESIYSSFKHINHFIVIGQDKKNMCDFLINNNFNPIRAYVNIINKPIIENIKCVAFCGIGIPQKFFDSLLDAGYIVLNKHIYDDHYQYSIEEILSLLLEAEKLNAKLITTKKDWIRIDKKQQKRIEHLDIEVCFYNKDELLNILEI
jgi:tetraacyldisaccharide 4'-kinase